jgi:glycosyltransferase involved in cell wall biosynthesis
MRVSDKISIVTATLPERKKFLEKMLNSVAEQIVLPAQHIVVEDNGEGFVKTVNKAVAMVNTEFFCLVDDDDIIYPNHVETLHNNLKADIVWTWCRVVGRDLSFNSFYEPGKLQIQPYIPSNMLMKTSLWNKMEGYRDKNHSEVPHPDWDMLRRCERSGATFLCVPEITWEYRFHGKNLSLNQIST